MVNIKRTLITAEEIAEKVKETGRYISEKYKDKPLLMVSILNGAFIFMADLCREVTVPCEIAFIAVKSYDGTRSTGNVEITRDIDKDISKYNVVIAEDIIDSGRTLMDITEKLKNRSPLSLEVITLLDKPARREVPFEADRSLFTIPDAFVVGYGLDCDEQFRNLRYIAECAVEE